MIILVCFCISVFTAVLLLKWRTAEETRARVPIINIVKKVIADTQTRAIALSKFISYEWIFGETELMILPFRGGFKKKNYFIIIFGNRQYVRPTH